MSTQYDSGVISVLTSTIARANRKKTALFSVLIGVNLSLGVILYTERASVAELQAKIISVEAEQKRRSITHAKMLEFLELSESRVRKRQN